jgi:hypothetical protein
VELSTVVFLGPSLARERAESLFAADYRPPVRRGDLPSLARDVDLVGIIDGVFMSEAAVGHREILALLERGTRVIGGGSMGALRASELHEFGMEGVGRIYELYSSGEVEGDDEVALTFHPETLEPLSEPLVNMRLNLKDAVSVGILDQNDVSSVLQRVGERYFPRRSIELLKETVNEVLDARKASHVRAYIEAKYLDYKRQDAMKVLASLRAAKGEIDDAARRQESPRI